MKHFEPDIVTRKISVYLIAAIAILMLACTSGSDIIPPTPPGPGPGGPILTLTDEQRIGVLNECGDFADALGDLKLDAQQQALVAYLKTRGEFADAGIRGHNVSASFHDGRLVLFIPDWKDMDSEVEGRLAAPDISGGRSDPETTMRLGVPDGKKVMLFHGLGNAYTDNGPYLSNIFSRSHTQYRVERKDATIENLKGAKDVDILYYNTHGGFAEIRGSPLLLYSLWTSDSLSVERDVRYKADLDAMVLSYMYALEDRRLSVIPAYEWHYGITERFVYEHMSFTENSLIYIDACDGFTSDAGSFRNMMFGRAVNSSTTYIGWTGPADDESGLPTSRYIFDRLLGAPVYMLESPPQRPFDFDPIKSELAKYNLGVSRDGAKLDYESTVDGEIILAPSIQYLTMDDYSSIMTIKGLFGDNERDDGTVTVGGISVPIQAWTPNEIICELPVTGQGSSGDVIVIVNGHQSNVVPLSEWAIPLHIIRDDFGIKIDVHLNIKIRADVHRYRSNPEETPRTDRPDLPMPLPNSLGFPCSVASTGTYTVGGQRIASCVKGDCTMRDSETVVTRSGVLPFSVSQPGLGYGAYYKWSPDMKKVDVNVIVNIPDVGIEVEAYSRCDGKESSLGQSVSTTLGIVSTGAPGLPVLEFQLDEQYNIKPNQLDPMYTIPWGRCEATAYLKHHASWPSVRPNAAPKPDTEARYAGTISEP